MICKFIGKNGSLGLRNGEYYNINIIKKKEKILAFIEKSYKYITECPYDNQDLFLKNWEIRDISREKTLLQKMIKENDNHIPHIN